MEAKVVDEFFSVLVDAGSAAAARGETREGRYTSISEAVEAAMRITLDRNVACAVQRVTVHTPVITRDLFGREVTRTETITGEVLIPGPRSWDHDPKLSRYHPVNGWAVPESIEIEVEE